MLADSLAEYLGVLLILAIALLLVVALVWLQLRLAPRRRFAAKLEPFECGESQLSSPRRRVAVKFYLVAIMFVVFDVAAIYFYPWGATFKKVGLPGLVAISIFTLPLALGFIYEWRKGALEW